MSQRLARRQYAIGVVNRRVARRVENLEDAFAAITGVAGSCSFMCACGRPGCTATLVLELATYDRVRSSPHRFVVAPGHATDIDEVVETGPGYEIVELRPEFRLAIPPTAELPRVT